ncbi:MAG TPA: hypothetical protein VJT08_03650, partial [Terriglobales bacterium]|nr:hypothetical protein [Terriglobales bacterium]
CIAVKLPSSPAATDYRFVRTWLEPSEPAVFSEVNETADLPERTPDRTNRGCIVALRGMTVKKAIRDWADSQESDSMSRKAVLSKLKMLYSSCFLS